MKRPIFTLFATVLGFKATKANALNRIAGVLFSLNAANPAVARGVAKSLTLEKKDDSSSGATHIKPRRLGGGTSKSYECPNLSLKEDAPELSDLEDWVTADYSEGVGITGTFKDKKYAYNSP